MKQNIIGITLSLLSLLTLPIWSQEMNSEIADSLKLEWLASDAELLPIEEGDFITLPGLGLFIEDGGTFYSLDSIRCPDIVKIRMKAQVSYEQVVISQGDILVKSHELIVRIHKDETSVVAELDTETFFLHAGSGTKYHLVVLEADDTWGWYTCDWETGEMTCVVRTPFPISHIFDNGGLAICVVGEILYVVNEEQFQLLAELPDDILDGVCTNQGMFLCTSQTLYFYDGNAEPLPLLRGDFHSLHYDGEVFYVVLQDGRILKTCL